MRHAWGRTAGLLLLYKTTTVHTAILSDGDLPITRNRQTRTDMAVRHIYAQGPCNIMRMFSLFAGIGGFDLAAARLGIDIIGACEKEKHALSVYNRHFPGTRMYGDARYIDPQELPKFDLLTAGFPCQSFSAAGRGGGLADARGSLFYEIVRICNKCRPAYMLLENVCGLLWHDGGRTFRQILVSLDECGYNVQWHVRDASYKVPQTRKRTYIACSLRGKPPPKDIFRAARTYSQSWRTRKGTKKKGTDLARTYSYCIIQGGGKPHAHNVCRWTNANLNAARVRAHNGLS